MAYFFKQWGEWLPMSEYDPFTHGPCEKYKHGWAWLAGERNADELPMSVFALGKKRAGRMLDGREWNEFPEVQA